jgi:hypothetical protein
MYLLSIGENVSRYDAKYTHQCESCQQDNETMKHLLMCPAQSRKEWRCLFMTHIRKHLAATETNLELMTIALDGIQTALNDTNLDHSRYPPHLQTTPIEARVHPGFKNARQMAQLMEAKERRQTQ